jgi:hypothetical protein
MFSLNSVGIGIFGMIASAPNNDLVLDCQSPSNFFRGSYMLPLQVGYNKLDESDSGYEFLKRYGFSDDSTYDLFLVNENAPAGPSNYPFDQFYN